MGQKVWEIVWGSRKTYVEDDLSHEETVSGRFRPLAAALLRRMRQGRQRRGEPFCHIPMFNAEVLECVECAPFEGEPSFCKTCGARIETRSRNCPSCGSLLLYEGRAGM